jgi:hypothetical protein
VVRVVRHAAVPRAPAGVEVPVMTRQQQCADGQHVGGTYIDDENWVCCRNCGQRLHQAGLGR